jgi:hypothetical protein
MTLALLILATLVVMAEFAVTLYPESVARLLAGADGDTQQLQHGGGHPTYDGP